MKLRVITKEREILNADIQHAILPGEDGQIDILPGHTRLMSLLQSGEIQYFIGNQANIINIKSGCAEVIDDRITALITLPMQVEEFSH